MKNSLLFIIFFLGLNISLFSQKKYHKSYFENGLLKEEGWINNGNKTGYWNFYHDNGNKKKEGHFKNNLLIKYWYFYHKDGSIKEEGHYLEGKQNKWWLFYDEYGNVNHKCQFKNGQKDGYCLIYEKNKIIKVIRFSNNNKIKEWTDFSSFKKENNLMDLR